MRSSAEGNDGGHLHPRFQERTGRTAQTAKTCWHYQLSGSISERCSGKRKCSRTTTVKLKKIVTWDSNVWSTREWRSTEVAPTPSATPRAQMRQQTYLYPGQGGREPSDSTKTVSCSYNGAGGSTKKPIGPPPCFDVLDYRSSGTTVYSGQRAANVIYRGFDIG